VVFIEVEIMITQKTGGNGVSPIPFNDSPKMGDAAEASERNYRRGFTHGFSMAIDAAEAGRTISDMIDYLNYDLVEWRESSADSEKLPPDLP
jgi:hypothetical protein